MEAIREWRTESTQALDTCLMMSKEKFIQLFPKTAFTDEEFEEFTILETSKSIKDIRNKRLLESLSNTVKDLGAVIGDYYNRNLGFEVAAMMGCCTAANPIPNKPDLSSMARNLGFVDSFIHTKELNEFDCLQALSRKKVPTLLLSGLAINLIPRLGVVRFMDTHIIKEVAANPVVSMSIAEHHMQGPRGFCTPMGMGMSPLGMAKCTKFAEIVAVEKSPQTCVRTGDLIRIGWPTKNFRPIGACPSDLCSNREFIEIYGSYFDSALVWFPTDIITERWIKTQWTPAVTLATMVLKRGGKLCVVTPKATKPQTNSLLKPFSKLPLDIGYAVHIQTGEVLHVLNKL